MAKSGGRFDCSFFKKEEGANEHSAEITLDTTLPLPFTRQRYKMGMDIPRRGSVFATLRRDKAIGVMRQRNKRAGGTPGRNQPPERIKAAKV